VPPYGLPAALAAPSHAAVTAIRNVFDGQALVLMVPKVNKLTGAATGAARQTPCRAKAKHKQGMPNVFEATVALRRTGAHGLRVIAADAADLIVEEEASYADCEPNAPRRQTTDSDTAAVRPRRRGRRLLAFCWS
jgi:hypothetical protein